VQRSREVRGVCVTKRSGPRVVWLSQPVIAITITSGLKSNQKGHLPKRTVSMMQRLGRRYNSGRNI
jgi:hypothetical protein